MWASQELTITVTMYNLDKGRYIPYTLIISGQV